MTSTISALAKLEADLDSTIKAKPIPGAAVAIVSRDSIEWIGTFGSANLATGEPVTEHTHFGLGSCTKSFVGLGFLKLVDEGRVDLNTPVHNIAPEIQIDNPYGEEHPVRVVHLLEHTAGFDDAHLNWFYFDGPVIPLKQALEEKAHLRRVRWQPGTRFAYSSPGYTLAGYVLGKIAGQPYEDFLKTSLLGPIGMQTSTIGCTSEHRRLLAVGYDREMEPYPEWFDYDEPAGAMNTSIREMALFVKFMLNRGAVDGQQIIGERAFEKIGRATTTLAAQAGVPSGYGFGIGVRYRSGRKWYGHSGAIPGFFADYAYNPDYGLGYVVLINTFDNVFYDDIFKVVEDYVDSRVSPEASPVPAVIPGERLRRFCGYYDLRSSRFQFAEYIDLLFSGMTIRYENDTLYSQYFMSNRRPLIPVTKTLFRRSDDPEATFAFTETSDGAMALASRGAYYERTASWKPVVHRTFFFGALIVMMTSLAYGLVWIPLYVFRRLMHSKSRCQYIWMRLVPFCAVLILILGGLAVGGQNILELGRMNARNVIFCVATWAFAGLSIASVLTTYRSFFRPVRPVARIYAVLVSAACCGMALYLGYWGMIGLRTWAF